MNYALGRLLFKQNIFGGNLLQAKDIATLCLWHTIEDDLLDRVFVSDIVQDEACDEKTKLTIRSAKHLVRWCLKGDASERPSVDAILKHPFLSDDTVVKQFHSEDDTHLESKPTDSDFSSMLIDLPMKYHAFLCFPCADGGLLGATLNQALSDIGIRLWYNLPVTEMQTYEKVKEGLLNSDIFLLVLTENILSASFCQCAFAIAIEHKKPIQILIEDEVRFKGFDIDKEWEQNLIPADLALKQTEALEKANAAVEKAAQTLDDNRRDKSSARNIDDLEKDVEKKGAIVKRIEKEIENRKNVERMIEVVKVNMKQAVPYRRMPYNKTLWCTKFANEITGIYPPNYRILYALIQR